MSSLELLLRKAEKSLESFTSENFTELLKSWKCTTIKNINGDDQREDYRDDVCSRNSYDDDGDKNGEDRNPYWQLICISTVTMLLNQSIVTARQHDLEMLLDILTTCFQDRNCFVRYSASKTFISSLEMLTDKTLFRQRVNILISLITGEKTELLVIRSIIETFTKLLSAHKHQYQTHIILVSLATSWQDLYQICFQSSYLECQSTQHQNHKQKQSVRQQSEQIKCRKISESEYSEKARQIGKLDRSNSEQNRQKDNIHAGISDSERNRPMDNIGRSNSEQNGQKHNIGRYDSEKNRPTGNSKETNNLDRDYDQQNSYRDSSDRSISEQNIQGNAVNRTVCDVIEHKDNCTLVCEFTMLWIQVVKRSYNHDENLEIENFIKPLPYMFSVFNSVHVDNLITLKKVTKLLNTIFNYEKIAASASNYISRNFIILGKETCDWIRTSGYFKTTVRFQKGFGGERTVEEESPSTSVHVAQEFSHWKPITNLVIKVSGILLKFGDDEQTLLCRSCLYMLRELDNCVSTQTGLERGFMWIAPVFVDQDDLWVETLLALLDVYIHGRKRCKCEEDEKILESLQPHKQFISFLKMIDYDHTLLVDLLISPETCFLLYMTRYLKLVLSEWNCFSQAHDACGISSVDSVELMDTSSTENNTEYLDIRMSEISHNMNGIRHYKNGGEICTDTNINVVQISDTLLSDKKKCVSNDKMSEHSEISKSYGLNLICDYSDDDDDDDDNDDDEDNDCVTEEMNNRMSLHETDDADVAFNVHAQSTNNFLDKTMATLIRVRFKLEDFLNTEVIQYNPKPLIHLIEKCENLYENIDEPT